MPSTTSVSMFLCIVLCSKQIFAAADEPPVSTTNNHTDESSSLLSTSPTQTVPSTTLSQTLTNSTVSTSLSSTESYSSSSLTRTTTTTPRATTATTTTVTSTTTTRTTTKRDCTPLSLENGLINSTSLSASSTAIFSCYRGYRLMGNKTLTCKEDGNWDADPPTCGVINCTPLSLENGLINSTSLSANSTAIFSCYRGYRLMGNKTLTCKEDGNWDADPPTCGVINCTPLSLENGLINSTSLSANSTAIFSCYRGYRLMGNKTLTCKEDGNWDADPPTCGVINCTPLSLENGLINSTSLSANSTAIFSCYRGYRLMGNKTLTCKEDGNWDADPPTCGVINCDNPQDPTYGKAQFSSMNVNSTVTYSCNLGYHLSANVTQTCQETPNEDEGSWQGAHVECLINESAYNSSCIPNTDDNPCVTHNATCNVEEQKCLCSTKQFYHEANDTCVNKIEFNGKCDVIITNEDQCATPNATCRKESDRCQCTDDHFYFKERSSCVPKSAYNRSCIPNTDNPCVTHNAICNEEEQRCLCSTEQFHHEANDTCVNKKPFNQPCVEDNQCLTVNSTCISRVCACNSSRQIDADGAECVLRPSLPSNDSLDIPDGTTMHNFEITWSDDAFFQENTFMVVTIKPSNKNGIAKFSTTGKRITVSIHDLYSGTLYHTEVKLERDEIESEMSYHKDIYTKPDSLSEGERDIRNINENSMDVVMKPTLGKNCETYKLLISPGPEKGNATEELLCSIETEYSYTFENLKPATLYNISIIVIAGKWNNSLTPTVQGCTLPGMISNAHIAQRHSSSVEIMVHYEGNNKDNITYAVVAHSSTGVVAQISCGQEATDTDNITFSDKTTFEVNNLHYGTNYTLEIYSCFCGQSSLTPYVLGVFTKPETPKVLISNVGEHMLTLTWMVTNANDASNIMIDINPKPTSTELQLPEEIVKNENVSGTYHFSNLISGIKYTVTVYSIIKIYEDNSSEIIRSEDNGTVSSYTRPYPANITILEQYETKVVLSALSRSDFQQLIVVSDAFENKTVVITDGTGELNELTMGSVYNMTFYTKIGDQTSSKSTVEIIYTRPGPPQNISIPLGPLHEKSFSVNWAEPEHGNVGNYCILLENQTSVLQNWTCLSSSHKAYSFHNLTGGELYTVYVTTEWKNLWCRRNISSQTYTKPPPPSASKILFESIETQFVVVIIKEQLWNKYRFDFSSSSQNFSTIVNSSELPVTIGSLEAGTKYEISVYSFVDEIRSERHTNISTYTKPGEVSSITVVSENNNSLHVQWNKPVGHYDSFEYNASCTSPNTGVPEKLLSNSTKIRTALLSPLDPGTYCSITVVAIIINVGTTKELKGNPVPIALNISTSEAAPGKVKRLNKSEVTNNSTTVHWHGPDKKNGVIRRYDAKLLENGNCISKIIFKCNESDCGSAPEAAEKVESDHCNESNISNGSYNKDNDSFSWDINGLHAFRNYSIEVIAYTITAGAKAMVSVKTLEYTPGIPVNLSIKNKTNRSIDLSWEPPEERNGIVKNYTVEYKYEKNICYKKNGTVLRTIVSTKEPINKIVLNGSDIYPFWTYTITVLATNNKGSGRSSAEKKVKTLESKPGKIKKDNVSVGNPTAFNVTVSWSTPCDVNGIILLYRMCLTNDSSFDHGLDTWKECYNTTNTNVESELSIFPYRNYSFTVSAVNSAGTGDESEAFKIKSQCAPPERPTNLEVEAEASDKIRAVWNTPSQFYGPVHYLVQAIDVKDPMIVLNTPPTTTAYWTDSLVTTSSISELDAFWEYNITVHAVSCNESRASPTKLIRTKEDIPGPVSLVSIVSESDVKKERSISIKWKAPAERDLNGILTNYWITCTKSDGRSVPLSHNTSANIKSFTFTNITPGNYNITVAAENNKGKGKSLFNTTLLKAGAPRKPKETDKNLLMKPSTVKVSDEERQISVQLPLHDLLCKPSDGQPELWGVVVVQDGNQDDVPFFGSLQDFKKQRLSVYKRWSQVKDDDSIPAYVATPEKWKPRCSSQLTGNRKKRSAYSETPYEDFVVGSQGECSGVPDDKNCNGELQPGRKYRVKSFVCTSRGCTETRYSKPISTEPDLTVPIAAGASSAIVVLVVVFVVIFILRRKQLVCFAKDPERSVRTHRPGNDIHLDKIESPKKNAFRPGPIKLSDFPDAVEKMHRDSDLLFADAYKLLKEKCPNHPMTAAEQQCSRPKNRYTNILPFDHSRVKLRPSDDIEGSDYINANYIPGYTSRREYIATQGAMQATFDDFWRMIWEQNVDTIVMLTKLMEKGRHKCDKYWPDLGEPVFYGDLVVSLQSESNLSDYTIKIFEVKMKEERKMVRHFSYLKWPDMGCPETPELLLEFVKAVRQYTDREKRTSSGPTVVHCSAGVGRTGTFIAVDHLLQHIRDHDEVDIYNLVLEMRNHRLNMVQTEDQYVYIHECLKAFITTDEEDEDEEDEHVYMNTSFGAQEENIYVNTGFEKE